jgi:hypothetical protein
MRQNPSLQRRGFAYVFLSTHYLSLSLMCLSHDVLQQILQYFEHEEGDLDAPEKRTVLLSMAVASRMLSGLALATLWKNMSSLQPIVNVINSFTTGQAGPLLTQVRKGDNSGSWVRLPIP